MPAITLQPAAYKSTVKISKFQPHCQVTLAWWALETMRSTFSDRVLLEPTCSSGSGEGCVAAGALPAFLPLYQKQPPCPILYVIAL